MPPSDTAPGSKACASCGAESPEIARFCIACGTPFADGGPVVAATPAPAHEEERRPITAVFVDIVGSTSRAERLDPEDVLALLEPYYDRLRGELERHGGVVEKFIGDAVVALFGAPVAHEDDPVRAVRAGLAVIDAIRALNEEDTTRDLSVRVGVTTGEAIVALDARVHEGRGMAWGDVLNTAARLQSSAPVDGVLVDERTRRACEGAISFEEAEPIQAKGKAERVPAWIAVRIAETRRSAAISPLVGREAELELLGALWDRTAVGHAGFGLVVAEAGIGKSRLVEEVAGRATAQGAAVVSGGCLPYGEGITYWPVAEMLRQAAGILASDEATAVAAKLDVFIDTLPTDDLDHLRTIASALAHLLGAKATPRGTYSTTEISQAELHWGVRRAVELVARGRPLVLVLEDLHWAEPTLIDLVDMLTKADGSVLVLATCRPEALELHPTLSREGDGRAVVELGVLDGAASEALVERLLAPLLEQGLDRAAVGRLVINAGGNPLFLEETARMLLDHGLLDVVELEALSVPANLQALVGARLDGLPPHERRLAQRVSVAGGVFWSGAAGYLDADGVELGLLESLARRGFLTERQPSSVSGEREWEFRHAVIRDVAYGRLPRGRRVALHVRFGDWVEQLPAGGDEFVEILAYHLEHACILAREIGRTTVEPPIGRAVSALVRAAAKAELREGVREANRYYARALALDPPDAAERVSIRLRHAVTLATLGDLTGAAEELREVAGAARALDRDDLLCESLTRLGNVSMKQGRASDARAALAEAMSLAVALDDDRLDIRAKYELSALRADFDGDVESATALLTDGLLRAESAGDTGAMLEGHLRLGMVFLNLLHLVDAERYLTRCAELASELGSIRDDARATALLAWVRFYRGPMDDARRLAHQAEDWFERTGDSYFRIQNLRMLGQLASAAGDDEEAEVVLQRARELASEGGGWLTVEISRCLVDVLVRAGKLDEAQRVATSAAADVAGEDPYAETALLLTGARLAEGQARYADAVEAFRAGIASLEQQQLRVDAAEARIAYARALRAAGDTDAAADELAAAHDALVAMGALGLADLVERERAGVTSSSS